MNPPLDSLSRGASRLTANGANRRSEKSEPTISPIGPSRLVLRSSWRSRDDTCLTDAGQIVTFTSAAATRTRPLDAERSRRPATIEWAFDSARFGAPVLTAFTPDGRIVAAAFGNNVVSCRESSTGKELFRYTSESPLRTLALSPDGRTLVAACESGVVELRSLATGRRIALSISDVPQAKSQPSPCIFTRWNQAGDDRMGHPRRGHAGDHLGRRNRKASGAVSRSSRPGRRPALRGRRPFAGDRRRSDDPVLVPRSGIQSPRRSLGHNDEAWAVAFAPDGKLLASGSDDDDPETIKLWDPKSGRLIRGWYGGPGTTASLAFSPDGRILASAHLAEQDNVRLWDVATGKRLATLRGHTARARTLAFHPHGKLLASAGSDKTIRLWDVERANAAFAR